MSTCTDIYFKRKCLYVSLVFFYHSYTALQILFKKKKKNYSHSRMKKYITKNNKNILQLRYSLQDCLSVRSIFSIFIFWRSIYLFLFLYFFPNSCFCHVVVNIYFGRYFHSFPGNWGEKIEVDIRGSLIIWHKSETLKLEFRHWESVWHCCRNGDWVICKLIPWCFVRNGVLIFFLT